MSETQELVLATIQDLGKATDEQLVEALDGLISPSGARSRRAELVAAGRVKDSGQRVRLESGRAAVIWEAVMTDVEAAVVASRLTELEQVIERGSQTFIEVGTALTEIRDSRLYKAEFSTFEAYCRERWSFSRSQAYRLIAASEMSPNGDISTEYDSRKAREPAEQERAASAGWKELSETTDAIQQLTRVGPRVVALSVPQRRRAATAKRLRKLGTFLGHIALELEANR